MCIVAGFFVYTHYNKFIVQTIHTVQLQQSMQSHNGVH